MSRKKGYGQFCPMAKAAEIVAERWTLLVLRELILGSTRFSELQRGVPLMSPSLLSQRLRELEDAGVVERRSSQSGRGSEYFLTEAGEELGPIIVSLGHWGERWARSQLQPEDYDPGLLMWDIRRRIDLDQMRAEERVVAEFDLSGVPFKMRRWWLVLDSGEVDLCLKDPGFEVDIYVSGEIRTLADVWVGHVSMNQAVRSGKLAFEGPRELTSRFRKSLKLSTLASP